MAIVLVGAALIGSGDGGEKNGRTSSAQAVAHEQRVDVGPTKRRVERLRQLSFRRPLEVTFASPRRTRSLFRALGGEQYTARERRADEEALKLLGLLEPSASLEGALRAIEEEQVVGFYDFRSRRLVVRRNATDSRGLQEIVLVHELVHALEDQYFDLRGEAGFGDDGALAEAALFEGTATALMTDYAERHLELDDLLGVLESVSGTETKLPRVVEQELLFPYEAGERFVASYRQGGRWRAVDQVMRLRHPRSTEQVIHPEKYAANESPVRLRVDDLTRRLGQGWRRLESSTVGELDLRLLFRIVGEAARSGAAAEGWGGGRFELWQRTESSGGCPAPCVDRDAGFMRLAWDTLGDRREGERALGRTIERGLHGRPLGSRRGAIFWSSRGGAIALRGHGLETIVVLTPTAPLAAALFPLPASRASRGGDGS